MEIERKCHDESMRRALMEEATEDKEEMAQLLRTAEEIMKKQARILDLKKQVWFPGLSLGWRLSVI